jgi:hypothetical protein
MKVRMHKTLNFVLVAFIALCLLSGAASAATSAAQMTGGTMSSEMWMYFVMGLGFLLRSIEP